MPKTKLQLIRDLAVEKSLERVRTAALEMRGSMDICRVSPKIHWQLSAELGLPILGVFVAALDRSSEEVITWTTIEGVPVGRPKPMEELPLGDDSARLGWSAWREDPLTARYLDAWIEGRDHCRIKVAKDEQIKHAILIGQKLLQLPARPTDGDYFRKHSSDDPESVALLSGDALVHVNTARPLTDEEIEVGVRFAKVFEYSISRYLELKRLEDQNRELQVEASLERVRSRAQGMQVSEELSEVATLLFEEFTNLGIELWRTGFWILNKEIGVGEFWLTGTMGENKEGFPFDISKALKHPIYKAKIESYLDGERCHNKYYTGDVMWDGLRYGIDELNMPIREWDTTSVEDLPEGFYLITPNFEHGLLHLVTLDPMTEEQLATSCRFADVFGVAYDRFQELKRLERQNRELQVEAALEHVRSRALGMQSSVEIPDVVEALFEQANALSLPLWRTGIVFLSKEEDGEGMWWSTSSTGEIIARSVFKMSKWRTHPFFEGVYSSWVDKLPTQHTEHSGQSLRGIAEWLGEHLGVVFPEYKDNPVPVEHIHNYWPAFDNGVMHLSMTEEIAVADQAVLGRFADVFGFAYSRMKELELAEEQARQAERRAAVDHIRAEIAAMQTTEDFERVTPLLWQTLNVLGVSFLRCGVFIHDREAERIHTYLSDGEGNPTAVLTISPDLHPFARAGWDRWLEGEIFVQPFTRDEFVELQLAIQIGLESVEGGPYVNPELLPEKLVAHTVPFSHGNLYVNSEEPLSRQDLAFVSDLAGAFSVAYARYQDFKQLEKQNEDLEEASRVKSRFLANMSHELRTPMNAIIGFTQLVLRRGADKLSERHRGNLEKVKQSADHLLTLINDVLDLSKIEANKMDIKPERFLVKELIASCCATVSPLVKSGVDLSFDVDDEVGEAFQDGGRMRQVIINLLSNALKFTESGKVKVQVRSKKAKAFHVPKGQEREIKGEELVIEVSDTGTGIPVADLESIFDEFQQVDGSATRKYQGTGLGLSICKMLTELMGGSIDVESEMGKGSVFTVRIPKDYAEGSRESLGN